MISRTGLLGASLVAGFALLLTSATVLLSRPVTPPAAAGSSAASIADAITHAHAAAELMDQALALYAEGSTQAAVDLMADAYLDHFEIVEVPLAEVDEQFMFDLELQIALTIRHAMLDGQPVEQVAALVARAQADLERALEMLQ
jgi:hypothetical protein